MIGAFLPKLVAILHQTEMQVAQARIQQMMQAGQRPPGAPVGPTAQPPGAPPQPMAAHPPMGMPPQQPQMAPQGAPMPPH